MKIRTLLNLLILMPVISALSACGSTGSSEIETPVVSMAVRPATFKVLTELNFPGKNTEEIKAMLTEYALAYGYSLEQINAEITKLTDETSAVWFDANGKEIGPLYFDPKTNSLIPNSRDGDPSNDRGVYYNPSGLPMCDYCWSAPRDLVAVAPDLVAKHSATYTGTGEVSLNVFGAPQFNYTAATTDTLTANFDNGTVGGTSVHTGQGIAAGETVTVQLFNGVIEGRNFDGEMEVVDNLAGTTLNQEGGDFQGKFNEDGTAVSGTGFGFTGGTTQTGENWSGTYDLKFDASQAQ